MSIPHLPDSLSSMPIQISTYDSESGFPVRILFIEQLTAIIGKSTTTIRTFATNKKYQHLIPRPFKMPGSRRLCWYENEVLEWIESTKPVEPPPPRRPRGRPTKAEQLAMERWSSKSKVTQKEQA
jgi:predicted DNA-binding transcriptional regulator AlpA